VVLNNGLWYLCCPNCVDSAPKDPALLKSLTDVVSGKPFKATDASPRSEHQGQHYVFESAETRAAFDKEPGKYAVIFGK
jgi:YHS domain-containing protein